MRAKDFLQSALKIDKMIENKMYEKSQWVAIATSTTANCNGERVQSSGSKQKMADAVEKYMELEKEIDRYIDELVKKKNEIIKIAEQLPAVEYDLLHKIYIQGKTLYGFAEENNKTYSSVSTLHGAALKKVQDILDRENRKK